MTTLLEPTHIQPPPARADDPRIGNLIHFAPEGQCPDHARIALIGFPCDEGVRTNGGRVGAAQAPDVIRSFLYRLTPDARLFESYVDLLRSVVDLGNIFCTGDVAVDQRRLGEVLAPLLQRGVVPIVLGGGHETAFGHFWGYALASHPVAILNVDAHPDVRTLIDGKPHSGSPFRQALEDPSGVCRDYRVVGLAPHSTARAHLDYLSAKGCRWHWYDEDTCTNVKTYLAEQSLPIMVTLDIDAVDQAFAPGVSAPNPCGLTVTPWLQMAHAAGRSPHVTSLDIVELNPTYDVQDRTARLAALTAWEFLRGCVERQIVS